MPAFGSSPNLQVGCAGGHGVRARRARRWGGRNQRGPSLVNASLVVAAEQRQPALLRTRGPGALGSKSRAREPPQQNEGRAARRRLRGGALRRGAKAPMRWRRQLRRRLPTQPRKTSDASPAARGKAAGVEVLTLCLAPCPSRARPALRRTAPNHAAPNAPTAAGTRHRGRRGA
eukprot:352122-Chlamydomonas_euryale.AAC.3